MEATNYFKRVVGWPLLALVSGILATV